MKLSTPRQIQIIADTITGDQKPSPIPGLTDPWRTYHTFILSWIGADTDTLAPAESATLYQDLVQRYGILSDEHQTNLNLIAEAQNNPIRYPPAAEMLANIPDLQWLWADYLPQGVPSLLAAIPGTGKSYLALDLAHRIISNTQYPDGEPIQDPGPVLYVDAENTPTIHKHRTRPWTTAHLNQLYFMLPADDKSMLNLDDYTDRDRLADMVWSIKPRLVIIDSYGAATLRGENNKEDVQMLLAFFNQLAKAFNCALLIIHHLRKGHAGNTQTTYLPMTIDSIRGSSHIPAMARHVWGLQWIPTAADADENGPRRLWIIKSNLSRIPAPLGVYFNTHPTHPDIAHIAYGDAPMPYKPPSKKENAATWLLDLLTDAGEPLKPAEIIELAEEDGYSRRTIYRARKQLADQITDTGSKHSPDNKWSLTEEIEEPNE